MIAEIASRCKKRPPLLFRKIRNYGLWIVGIGTAIATLPISLPAAIVAAGGYLVAAGTVAAAVGSLPNEGE
jgi:small-conductance mechanosensitive channel